MQDRLEALRLAARRLDEAMEEELHSPDAKAKAEVTKAAAEYARALDDLHKQPAE